MQPLMQRASEAKAPAFKRPDPAQFIPKGQEDNTQRIIAAGMKMMYSPEMRDELQQAVEGEDPAAQKMAENVTGLMLMLDQQAQGGMPEGAMFPAAIGLLGEAADVLVSAGQTVTQDDFNEAARMLFVMMSKKMGASEEDIMDAAKKNAGGMGEEDGPEEQMAPPEEEQGEYA